MQGRVLVRSLVKLSSLVAFSSIQMIRLDSMTAVFRLTSNVT